MKIKTHGYNSRITLLLMAIPALLLFFAFSYVPLFGWIYSLFEYKVGVPLSSSQFVGIKYLKMAVMEPEVLNVVRNTLVISFLNLILGLVPVVFAIMLSELKSNAYRRIIQTTTTLPNFISWILVYAFIYAIFSSDGAINQFALLVNPNASTISVLSNNEMAWYIQAFINLWKTLGWNAIIYMAAITSIEQEQYEAAMIDGAGRLQRIRHITIPGISETYLVLLLLSVAWMLSNGFDQFFVFNNPIVADKLDVLDYYVYRVGIQNDSYSYATAIGIYKTLISIILLFVCNNVARKVRGTPFV